MCVFSSDSRSGTIAGRQGAERDEPRQGRPATGTGARPARSEREAIPNAWLRQDVTRTHRIRLELSPQVRDVNAEVRLRVAVRTDPARPR